MSLAIGKDFKVFWICQKRFDLNNFIKKPIVIGC